MNVIFGVASCKQHTGYSENACHALFAQLVQAIFYNRVSKFQIAILNWIVRHPFAQGFRDFRELRNGKLVSAAVATHHHPKFFSHLGLQ